MFKHLYNLGCLQSPGQRNMFTLREALNLIFTKWYFCKYSHIFSSPNIFHLREFPLETLDKQRSSSSKQNQTDKSFYCSMESPYHFTNYMVVKTRLQQNTMFIFSKSRYTPTCLVTRFWNMFPLGGCMKLSPHGKRQNITFDYNHYVTAWFNGGRC